ncbi:MAG: hypothetical protein M3N93_10690 [Acidobacteriota bacterium]|nr:hypothetical protein [Acidobacteriota bacterium]
MPSVKKTWLIDPAKKIFGARTETETLTGALRETLIHDEIEKAFRRHSQTLAELEQIFPDNVLSAPS